MRQSFGTSLIAGEGGEPYAAFAKADFCAEHEWGVGGLHRAMGCGDPTVDGIDRYRMSPSSFVAGGTFFLTTERFYLRTPKGVRKTVEREVLYAVGTHRPPAEPDWLRQTDDPFDASFDARNFRLVATSEAGRAFIQILAERAPHGDVAAFMGGHGGNPFDRGGLVVCIPSRTPDDRLLALRAAHVDARRLDEAARTTGIRERLDASGLSGGTGLGAIIYALSPAWADTIKSRKADGEGAVATAHPVIFWLNTGRNFYGWYTVEELDQWIEGRGPVIEEAREREARNGRSPGRKA